MKYDVFSLEHLLCLAMEGGEGQECRRGMVMRRASALASNLSLF